jgi:hypothetical protein
LLLLLALALSRVDHKILRMALDREDKREHSRNGKKVDGTHRQTSSDIVPQRRFIFNENRANADARNG